jgi:3-phenylpropionate/trans-cinnamate dioxygenase ferredoxin reductase subunit
MSGGVVIVGAGHAGMTAAASLREAGYDGTIQVLGEEPELPYERPPLSKAYLVNDLHADAIALRAQRFLDDKRIELLLGTRATGVDRTARIIQWRDSSATGQLGYEHLILATGTRARQFPLATSATNGVLSLRTLADAQLLRRALVSVTHDGGRVVVLGAGFIGLEVAAAASKLHLPVSVIEVAPRVLGRSASEPLATHLTEIHLQRGVDLRCGLGVVAVRTKAQEGTDASSGPAEDKVGRVTGVELSNGEVILCSLLVTGIGVEVNDDLARQAGLNVENGIVVDEMLRTSDPHVSAIGDCAVFPSSGGRGPWRLESVQNATDQARHVARRIAGAESGAYDAVPWFWTDQHGQKVQIAGVTTGHDSTVRIDSPSTGSSSAPGFSVLCFAGPVLLGVESINRPSDHMAARRLLSGKHRLPTPEEASVPSFDLRGWLGIASTSKQTEPV